MAKTILRARTTTGVALGGAIAGGKNYFEGKNNTGKMSGGFANSVKGTVSKPIVASAETKSKVAKYAKMPTRIATLPLGVIKDVAKGGVVGASRNIGARARNAFTGDTLFNHAEIKPKPLKEKKE